MGKGKGKRNKARKQYDVNEFEIEQDENFYFIAGYTPGGLPYGVTWEEAGVEMDDVEDVFGSDFCETEKTSDGENVIEKTSSKNTYFCKK